MLSITKIFSFEAAHRISDYMGACSQIHGHSYKLQVTIGSENMEHKDMVMDFKELKQLVKEHILQPLDHALILKRNKANLEAFEQSKGKIFWMETEPTAERIVLWVVNILVPMLNEKGELKKVKLFETETCFVEWEI